jgi:hypothetical protein
MTRLHNQLGYHADNGCTRCMDSTFHMAARTDLDITDRVVAL